jgi:hypothetical protein
LGHATKLVVERVRSSHVLVLETNHDMKLLQDDAKRPWSVKQRILSRHGHLSTDAAANVLAELVSAELENVYLGHLSRDCNRPDLALKTVQKRLDEVGATHVHVNSTSQDTRCETLTLCAIEKEFVLHDTVAVSSGYSVDKARNGSSGPLGQLSLF